MLYYENIKYINVAKIAKVANLQHSTFKLSMYQGCERCKGGKRDTKVAKSQFQHLKVSNVGRGGGGGGAKCLSFRRFLLIMSKTVQLMYLPNLCHILGNYLESFKNINLNTCTSHLLLPL